MIDINTMKVLIADDMPGMCKSIRGIMKLLGYGRDFVFANNGAQAWRKLETEEVDLAIIDWNMPIMKGVDVLRNIRDDNGMWDMPVVMVTAEADPEIVAEVAETDIDAYLLKPLTVKSLGDRVARVIHHHNNPPPAVQLLRHARNFYNEGKLAEAVAAARKAVEMDPGSTKPIRQLGYYFLKNNNLDDAEKCFLAAINRNKLDVFSFNQLGELYMQRQDFENAAKFLDEAMKISPRQLDRGIRLGTVLLQTGMRDKARQTFDKTISVSREQNETREMIVDICEKEGDIRYAANLLIEILQNTPGRPDLLVRLGLFLEELGDNQEAVKRLTLASDLDAKDPRIKMHLARNYLAMKRPMWAEKYLNQVLKADPENEEAREMLQQCL
ncbi:tetratricopeptide repeat protein [Desulfatibacillum aliphaticivorans]|uniref:tetratricopeptide repeat protein n=1 Tax=Desulfatibacillum aliphaticivorans TaxID=218208 RepID=UPI000413AAE6|nr:tetratricopeptide repeat protein [Desulfatibacillum aliphaticivorans]